jgi:hypothetical protein
MRPPEMRKAPSVEKAEINLLAQAKNSGPQKYINRNEALARAGGATLIKDEKKNAA